MTRVYDAERAVFGRKMSAGMSLADATQLIHDELGADWSVIRKRRARQHTELRDDYGSYCNWSRKTICLGYDAGLPVVLHEIAHGLVKQGHTRDFQVALLSLIDQHMGRYWARRLRVALAIAAPRGSQAALRQTSHLANTSLT